MGRLEVICGSMFSGKSEELIRRMRRCMFAKQQIQVFKHSFDNRKNLEYINAHNGDTLCAEAVFSSSELENLILKDVQVIGIDEVQFFDLDIILVLERLVNQGKTVIASGLDLDFRGIPFGPIPYLLAIADDIVKLKAICSKTCKEAHFSQRLINGCPASSSDPVVLIGAEERYQPRSRNSFEIDYIPLKEYLYNKKLQ